MVGLNGYHFLHQRWRACIMFLFSAPYGSSKATRTATLRIKCPGVENVTLFIADIFSFLVIIIPEISPDQGGIRP
jgi:hypothetical protein